MRILPLVLSLLSFNASLSATPITSIDGQEQELTELLLPPATLLLTVRDHDDLPDAQRLLTLAAANDQTTIILIELPGRTLDAIAIRRAAKRYFQSDLTRPHTYFIEADNHPYPEFKTLLLSPVEPSPLFASKSYPEELPSVEK
ncbi:hypothetical protein IEN85_04605 [Pelagicoccus sp. NFK12]|uniref:DUF4174 domain-containing protein n=1 Tax=Pelagicoccus enzymogenes TaxID=2773457 RepID=A0A927F7U3_9BACT|nr:hypothetical protein [Pelagicoccus enzymogenes]MBD5778760.1 hypothetical protein [Pelagicoccus enzymogenes]